MHIYGDLPPLAACGILLLFSLYVGLYHALFGWCIGLLRRNFTRRTVLLLFPFAWVAVELARARITGFPWDLLGYTAVDNLFLTRLAPVTGVMGLSFVIAAVNSLWFIRSKGEGRRAYLVVVVTAAFVVIATLLGLRRGASAEDAPTATAVVLQENLSVGAEAAGASESRDQLLQAFDALSFHPTLQATVPRGMQPLSAQLLAAKPSIIAWPEAPAAFFDADTVFRQSMGALASQTRTPVIVDDIAFADRDPDGHRSEYNSAAFFLADGSYAGRYDKMRLVPFGEYTPYKPLFFFAGHLLDQLPFVPGLVRRNFKADGKQLGIFICYESIFGDDIRYFAKTGAQVLVNISDDGWYGDSSAPWEHLDMVRMRAIENNRWIVRATNTGITASIDPYGRVTATMPRHLRGSMIVGFAYRSAITLYTRFGDWFAWLCAIVTLAALLFSYRDRIAGRGRREPQAVR